MGDSFGLRSHAVGHRVPKEPACAKPSNATYEAPNGKPKGSDKRFSSRDKKKSETQKAPQLNSQSAVKGPLYAALDLGTNNCRLLVARPHGRSFKVVDGFSCIVRLGEALNCTGALSQRAMDKAIAALKMCKAKLDKYQPCREALIATEACRQASNADVFLRRVRDQVGIELDIIDRETEAKLAVIGCAKLIDRLSDGVILFDIGGGSSELAWLDFSGGIPRNAMRMAGAMRHWHSFPFGVMTIAEKFQQKQVSPALFEEMVAYAAQELNRFKGRAKLQAEVARKTYHFLGTSGTVTTLGGIHRGLKIYQRCKVDGLWLSAGDIDVAIQLLLNMSYDQRVAHPCVGRGRADLVIPGCAIFEAMRRIWPCPRLRVADRGLREGLLVRMMSEDGHLRHQPPRLKKRSLGKISK